MAIICETLTDAVGWSSSTGVAIEVHAVNQSAIADLTTHGLAVGCLEGIGIDDAMSEQAYAVITEGVALSQQLSAPSKRLASSVEGFTAYDRAIVFLPTPVVEAVDLSDAVSPSVRLPVIEQAVIDDTLSSVRVSVIASNQPARVLDRAVIPLYAMLSQSLGMSDAAAGRAIGLQALIEHADIADAAASTVRAVLPSIEQAGLSSAVVLSMSSVVSMADAVYLDDSVLMPFGYAWTANTDNFAMSRYENWPFNSMAEVDGRLVALSDDGAYLVEGANDAGESINASIRGGMTDFGDNSLKRVSYAYMGYEGGRVSLTVGMTESGSEVSYTYSAMSRTANDPSAGRIKLGKGMRSRYWRFTIANEGGDDFTLFDMRVLIDGLSRKV